MPRRSCSARVGLAIVAGVLVASSSCTLVEGDAKGGPGAACAKDEDCESSSCRTEGFCGVNGCRGNDDCPTGWTCER